MIASKKEDFFGREAFVSATRQNILARVGDERQRFRSNYLRFEKKDVFFCGAIDFPDFFCILGDCVGAWSASNLSRVIVRCP